MVPQKVMQADKVYFFIILLQLVINSAVLNALEETSVTSRSAFFAARKNTRLKGYVVKWFYSPSVISCSQVCAKKSWCTSTNFKEASRKNGKGTCELNRHGSSVMDEEGKLESLQGVTFSLHIKGCLVTGCTNGLSCLFDEKNNSFACLKKKAVCSQSVPLGMEDGSIPDNKITVSSTHTNQEAAWGRLHCSQGSWTPVAESDYQWFQVDFVPEVKLITRIATQGYGNNYYWWVTTYYVMYKAGGAALEEYKENNQQVTFQGNTNKDDVATNEITNPFEADTVRIIPTAYSGRIALRIELYGCDIYNERQKC
ncbi:coagulation factor V-like [Oculina patagonica]